MAPRSSQARKSPVAQHDFPVPGAHRASTDPRWLGGQGGAENDDRASPSAPASLSQLQCETAQYIADLTDSLAEMARLNGLATLTALLSVIAREADSIGRTEHAA
jgi:hypothetical protein